jgi:formylglycine-generating enzyme required for sulfatase activity
MTGSGMRSAWKPDDRTLTIGFRVVCFRPADQIVNSIGMRLNRVPAGEFVMGQGTGRPEGPAHRVRITRPFHIEIFEVTQAQYEAVMGDNPSRFKAGDGGGPDHPVERVSWDQAVEFCRRLSDMAGERAAGRAYRLPTEAEWEYACRAGTTTDFFWGNTASHRDMHFKADEPFRSAEKGPVVRRTVPVGGYRPNAFGLYDTHGNVFEMCSDWYDTGYYAQSPADDPPGPDSGEGRVIRGGSWMWEASDARATTRGFPKGPGVNTGFRVVCVSPGDGRRPAAVGRAVRVAT